MTFIDQKKYILSLLSAVLLLSGCAVQKADPQDIHAIRTIVVGVSIQDKIGGKKRTLIGSDDAFPVVQLDWRSTSYVRALIENALKSEGYNVVTAEIADNIFRSEDDVSNYVKTQLEPRYHADAYLLMNSGITSLGGEGFTHGLGGAIGVIIGEGLSTKYYGYAIDSGFHNAICYHNYNLALLKQDGKIIAHKYVNMNEKDRAVPIPGYTWVSDYRQTTPQQKELVRNSCMKVFTQGVPETLHDLGLTGEK